MRWHVRIPGEQELVAVVTSDMAPTIDALGATFYREGKLVAHFKHWISILKDEAEDAL